MIFFKPMFRLLLMQHFIRKTRTQTQKMTQSEPCEKTWILSWRLRWRGVGWGHLNFSSNENFSSYFFFCFLQSCFESTFSHFHSPLPCRSLHAIRDKLFPPTTNDDDDFVSPSKLCWKSFRRQCAECVCVGALFVWVCLLYKPSTSGCCRIFHLFLFPLSPPTGWVELLKVFSLCQLFLFFLLLLNFFLFFAF